MGFLGGQGLPGLLGLGTNVLNVLFNWDMMNKAMAKRDELQGKADGHMVGGSVDAGLRAGGL